MNERILKLRKQLALSQDDFGAKLGITRSSVSNMESGRYNVTDTLIILICREFGVNENWLRTGEGEMFIPFDDEGGFERIWEQVSKANSPNADFIKRIMRAYWSLSDEKQAAIAELVEKISEQ